MKSKNLYLVASIITFVVFLGFLGEPGPHEFFGREISIWYPRVIWFVIAMINIRRYIKITKSENESK